MIKIMAQGMTNSIRMQVCSLRYEYIFELWKKYFVVDGKASKIPDAMMLVDI